MENKVEVMAPAGNFESLAAAIKSGADSVYFGVEQLNMRAKSANNFTLEDLKKVVKICGENKIKTYLTLNTVMYDHDIILMKKICDAAKKSKVTCVICSDMAAINYANSIGLEVHISTQVNVSNMEAVRYYSKYADVIVLARELTLKQIQYICDTIKQESIKGLSGELLRIEIFAHGALCVAVSGKCYMSLATNNASANRGACTQNCRKSYRVIDEETGQELSIDNKYIMSPKDLCTIGFIDKLLNSGITVLKIEGRGRSADYVYVVTRCYKEAVDSYYNNTYTKEKIDAWIKQLESVFNRGFWHGGYYLGKQLGEWSGQDSSQATEEKEFLGLATNYFNKNNVAEFTLNSGELKIGDKVVIIGPTTGVVYVTIDSMHGNNGPVDSAKKGDLVSVAISEKIRINDKLYLIKKRL